MLIAVSNKITISFFMAGTQISRFTRKSNDWSLAERLQILMESHGLDGEELNAFCREKGIFRHHLEQWQAAFAAGGAVDNRSELRELKDTNKG